MKEKFIKVLKVEPYKKPEVVTLKNELSSLQEAVGGLIEFVGLDYDNSIDILCNEEGKLIGLEPNRKVGSDIIVGVFYVIKTNLEGDCCSLDDTEIEKYRELFKEPEYYTTEDVIKSINYGFTTF